MFTAPRTSRLVTAPWLLPRLSSPCVVCLSVAFPVVVPSRCFPLRHDLFLSIHRILHIIIQPSLHILLLAWLVPSSGVLVRLFLHSALFVALSSFNIISVISNCTLSFNHQPYLSPGDSAMLTRPKPSGSPST